MASSGLKKMLILIISNTEGVIVLVCPAIFGHLMGLVADVITTWQMLCLLYWLVLPIDFYMWQMLLPLL